MRNVYDFDKTIYNGDSTIDFYLFCIKKNKKILLYLPIQIFAFILYFVGIKDKNYFKEKFYSYLKIMDNIDDIINEFWDKNYKKIKKWYLNQKKESDIIISASPEFLLIKICEKLNVNLLASLVDKKNGKLLSENCYGNEKINRLEKEYKNITINKFYSDSYSDEPLALSSKKSYLVKKNKIIEWDFHKKNSNKSKLFKFIKLYSLIFAFMFFVCFEIYFLKHGKSYFRPADGLDQHYLIFSYFGVWFRNIVLNLINSHSLIVPLWNSGIGYGADILVTNAAYFFDPFNYLSIFFKPEYSEIGYNLMIYLKIYFCGIAFGIWGIYKKFNNIKILIGSLLYSFCSTIFIVFIESFFINPMYIFPILMIGTDKLLKQKKYNVYVISLAFAFINYFYFAYMMCIFIFFYVILEILFNYNEYKKQNILNILFRFLIFSLLAFGISAFVMFPILKNMLNMNRLGVDYFLPKFYDENYYKCILSGFYSYCSMSGRDAIMGYSVIGLISVIAFLILKNKKYNKIKLEFILLTIVLLIPFLGSVMNGFSYYANRWIFAYAFIVCNITCIMVDEFKKMKEVNYFWLIIICLTYFSIILIYYQIINLENIVALILSIFIIIVLYKLKNNLKLFNNFFLIITIFSLFLNASFSYRESKYNRTNSEIDRGTAYQRVYKNESLNLLNKLDDDNLRYNQFSIDKVRNSGWLYNRSGLDHYISMYNNDINTFNDNIGLNTQAFPMQYDSLDRKSELNYLFGVNYFIINKNYQNYLPYGYNKKVVENDKFAIYSPQKDASLIYEFENVMNSSDYANLNSFDKQNLLLQSIVLDNTETNYSYNLSNDIKYKINFGPDIINNGNKYMFNKNSYIDLIFNDITNSEIYLYMNNIKYLYNDKYSYNIKAYAYNDENVVDNIHSNISGKNNKTHMYGNKQNYLLNLGYTDNNINKIRIYFDQGEYAISELKIYNRDLKDINNTFNNLKNVSKELSMTNNTLKSQIVASNDGYLFISLPYANGGWNAYVDGNKVEVLKADDAFMAINITKGEHTLVMKYRTPLLLIGIFASLISIVVLIIINKNEIKLINLIEKNKLIIDYLFFGVLTVIINIVSYYVLYHIFNFSLLISNIFAWIFAVIFAFFTNKNFVFKSKNSNLKKELISFTIFRLVTLLVDLVIMCVFVDFLHFNDLLIKILSNIIVIILNYITSKLIVFKKNN